MATATGTNPTTDRSGRPWGLGALVFTGLLVLGWVVLAWFVSTIATSPITVVAALMLAIGAAAVVWKPVASVYFLVVGAVTFETFRLGYPDSLTDNVPFFQSLASRTMIPLPLSMAELLMLGGIGGAAVAGLARRNAPLTLGPYGLPIIVLGLVLMSGVVRGLLSGGAFEVIAFEVRGFLYLALAYLLVVNLVKTVGQVRLIVWLALVGIAFKGLVGVWRYVFTLDGDLSQTSILSATNSLMSHEESYFYALFLLFVAAAWLFRTGRMQMTFALVFAAPVALALLANERRAATIVLLAGLVLLAALVFVTNRARRPALLVLGMAFLLIAPVYVVGLNEGEGLIAEPAAAIASVYSPDERDASSNAYRSLENENLVMNIRDHPVLGDGFGKPVPLFLPVPDLSDRWSLWSFMPHNNALWLWHRVGFIGVVAFWFVAGRFVIGATLAARETETPYLRLIASMALVAFIGWITIGLLDLGFTDMRISTMVGLMAGLVAILPRLEGKTDGASAVTSTRRPV